MTAEELKRKMGSIMKVAYMPQFSVGFKAFCKTYVKGEYEPQTNEDTVQYHVDNIWAEIEGMEFQMRQEDKELYDYITEVEEIEYLEF